jgi:hypothetical protein
MSGLTGQEDKAAWAWPRARSWYLLPRMLSVSSGDVFFQCRQAMDKSPDLGRVSLAQVTYMALAKCLLSKRSRDCQCQGGMNVWKRGAARGSARCPAIRDKTLDCLAIGLRTSTLHPRPHVLSHRRRVACNDAMQVDGPSS